MKKTTTEVVELLLQNKRYPVFMWTRNKTNLWVLLGITVLLGLVVEGTLVDPGDVVVTTVVSDVVPEQKHQFRSDVIQNTKL